MHEGVGYLQQACPVYSPGAFRCLLFQELLGAGARCNVRPGHLRKHAPWLQRNTCNSCPRMGVRCPDCWDHHEPTRSDN